jgi:tRNA (guanine-N7-)-methyltransferase
MGVMTTPKQKGAAAARHREIRSYVLRKGRMTAGQQRAMDELWPIYGITTGTDQLDFADIFERTAPITLEIGFGNGESIVAMAHKDPQLNFIGIEVHEPGVGHCLLQATERQVENIRVMRDDAVEILRTRILNSSLARINLFFPDPWHKKRHHKRRIVQPDFVALLASKLRPGGMFHVATDWPNYAEHIAEVMANSPAFEPSNDVPDDRIETRFDSRGQRLGHSNWERAWCTTEK